MNYQQAVDFINSYTDYEKTPMPHAAANYDLRRVEQLLGRLGKPHLKAKSVHIAGTKGKGSTAAMIASVLAISGYNTGLYTSPHLHTIRERIRLNDKLISEGEFIALIKQLQPEVKAVNHEATYGELTTFELLTALGFAYFSAKQADFQVLEVGLGGKYDATNVVNPEVCIITSVSFDHMEILGHTLTEIATEKAGIIKSGSTVVTSPQAEEVDKVIKDVCLGYEAELVSVGRDVTWQSLGGNLQRQLVEITGRLGSYELSIPLLGQHQLDNAATAVAALEVLAEKGFNISRASIIDGLARVNWPGRFHILSHCPTVVVDGAHNPNSTRKLRHTLEQYFGSSTRAILVIGASSDKDIAGMASELVPFFHRVIATRSKHPRTMIPSLIVNEFAKHAVETRLTDDIPAALSLALASARDKDLVCVTGSLFVVAEAIEEAKRLRLT